VHAKELQNALRERLRLAAVKDEDPEPDQDPDETEPRVRQAVREIVVVDETASTQDDCRERSGGKPGCCCVALHQTQGRGRLNRRWLDCPGSTAMFTLSIPLAEPPERVPIRAGLAVCAALEALAPDTADFGIKWPNDVMHQGRKIAGVLIEASGSTGFLGIGINVNARPFLPDAPRPTCSLAEITGRSFDLDLVIWSVLRAWRRAMDWDEAEIRSAFAARDRLRGRAGTFESANRRVRGRVVRIDPLRGLEIREIDSKTGRVSDESLFLPASQTTVLDIEAP